MDAMPVAPSRHILHEVRVACASVTDQAALVRIDDDGLRSFADRLAVEVRNDHAEPTDPTNDAARAGDAAMPNDTTLDPWSFGPNHSHDDIAAADY